MKVNILQENKKIPTNSENTFLTAEELKSAYNY